MTTTESNGRSVQVYLANGTPIGIITAEIANRTGKAVSGPRSRLSDLLHRKESRRMGVYLLTGPDPEQMTKQKVYIGEGENVGKRLR